MPPSWWTLYPISAGHGQVRIEYSFTKALLDGAGISLAPDPEPDCSAPHPRSEQGANGPRGAVCRLIVIPLPRSNRINESHHALCCIIRDMVQITADAEMRYAALR